MKKSLAILLATYNPRVDWLAELLQSLNRQTYPHIRLYVRDDASDAVSLQTIQSLLVTHITRFPFVLLQNTHNVGSNETFSRLLCDCREEYVAFCDQDDVWDVEKIANSVTLLEKGPLHPHLVCTNARVIDENGRIVADTVSAYRPRHLLCRGCGLAERLIYRNFVMGCTVLMARRRALSYLPFPTGVVHDHYLAFRAATEGAIDFLSTPQLSYRIWGGNQTGVLQGIRTKSDYLTQRIEVFSARVQAFRASVPLPALDLAERWCEARKRNFERTKGAAKALYRLRRVNPSTTWFELIALRLPAPLFRLAIRAVQRGWLS